MIGLLGATGYTGRLVAAELAVRGLPHRLGGRSRERLGALPESPHGAPYVVDTGDPAALRGFLDGLDAVISCVGPFARLGLPVVEAAVTAGVPYVDSTGEPDFMAEVYRRYGDAATAVVPACGFDYLPGDLAAAVAAEELGGMPSAVVVGYEAGGMRASRGTIRSAIGAVAAARAQPRRMTLDFPDGPRDALELPWGEQLTVPRHLPGATVTTAVVVGRAAAAAAPALGPLLAATRPLLARAAPTLDRLAGRLPEGPPERRRQAARFRVLARASAGEQVAGVLVEGNDVYGLTARTLVEAATRASGAGALAPAQALPPRSTLDSLRGKDFRWSVV